MVQSLIRKVSILAPLRHASKSSCLSVATFWDGSAIQPKTPKIYGTGFINSSTTISDSWAKRRVYWRSNQRWITAHLIPCHSWKSSFLHDSGSTARRIATNAKRDFLPLQPKRNTSLPRYGTSFLTIDTHLSRSKISSKLAGSVKSVALVELESYNTSENRFVTSCFTL